MYRIKTAVIGVGHLGINHARIYHELQNTDLSGVIDTDKSRAEEIAARFCTAAYTSFDDFLQNNKPDALSIVVPTSKHFEIAKKAIEKKINVLVEKPVTVTVDEAEELGRLAKENNVILQVGHIERFNSAVRNARKYIKNPYLIQTRRISPFSNRISDVGVVLDLMIHDVDIILSLIDSKIVSVKADGLSARSSHEDIATVQMCFENGSIAQLLVSRLSEKRMRMMEITCPENYITVNFAAQEVKIEHTEISSDGKITDKCEALTFEKREPLKAEIEHFAACVANGIAPEVGIEDGRRALEICVEALRQINLKK